MGLKITQINVSTRKNIFLRKFWLLYLNVIIGEEFFHFFLKFIFFIDSTGKIVFLLIFSILMFSRSQFFWKFKRLRPRVSENEAAGLGTLQCFSYQVLIWQVLRPAASFSDTLGLSLWKVGILWDQDFQLKFRSETSLISVWDQPNFGLRPGLFWSETSLIWVSDQSYLGLRPTNSGLSKKYETIGKKRT